MTPREPTEADLQAAFAILHTDEWPQDLHALRMAAARMKLVQATARDIANGGRPARTDAVGLITNAPTHTSAPPAFRGWTHKQCSRPLTGPDLKRLAAGDRDD